MLKMLKFQRQSCPGEKKAIDSMMYTLSWLKSCKIDYETFQLSLLYFRCGQPSCGALVRPHVVWFGEDLDFNVLTETDAALEKCDMCLLVRIT